MSDAPQDDALLLQLILIFQQTAWQSLGKIQNPQTGETKVDLSAASHAIDMLAMLDAKTKGNLTDAERNLLSNSLTQLRLNYVEVQKEQAAAKPEGESEGESKPGTPKSADSEDQAT